MMPGHERAIVPSPAETGRVPSRLGHCVSDEIPTAEAARRLAVSANAVRKRLRRRTLTGRKTDAGWIVSWTELAARSATHQDVSEPASALIRRLEDEVQYLATSSRRVMKRRAGCIIPSPAPSERIPELPSGETVQDAAQSENLAPRSDEIREMESTLTQPAWCRFWRRIRGGG